MIADQVRRTLAGYGDATAVHFNGRPIAGRRIAVLADAVVRLVDAAAPDPLEPVAFAIRNRPAHLAALFGLVAAARPIRLVNAFQSPAKIAADLSTLAARVVLADLDDWATEELAGFGRQAGIAAIGLGENEVASAGDWEASAPPAPPMAQTAIELTTSGTSGVPKRIRFSAASLTRAIADQAAIAAAMGEQPASAGDEAALIQYAPILHIAGLWTALQAAAEGRQLVLLEKFTAAAWVDAVSTLRPALAGMSPPLLRMVLEMNPPRAALASLAAIRSGSAALDADTRAGFEQRYGIPLLQVYGATEYAGVVAAWSLADHHEFHATKARSAGRVLSAMAEMRVVDAADNRVLQEGEAGVLEVRVPRVGEDWIRASDIASIDADGFLTLLGRSDSAITRGGFKILPDQLVTILRRHAAVADAAVVGLDDRRLGQVPVAAVELRADAQVETAELDRHMRAELPAYQVPARFLIVDQLPRTPAGKIIPAGVRELFEAAKPL